jgi:glutaminyl-peptide cyclotransferase
MKGKILILIAIMSCLVISCSKKSKDNSGNTNVNYKNIKTPAFNADSAYNFVKVQCDFGARIPESKAAKECGDYLISYLKSKADTVYVQEFTTKLWNGKQVKGRNIIASFNPTSSDRVLFASHWDSRLWADNDSDKTKQKLPVIAANDGASGVGVLMEVARVLHGQKLRQGVDLVLFDMEDQGSPQWADTTIEDQSDWCLGAQYWAQHLHVPYYTAKYGVLLDMVGYSGLRFLKEQQSMAYASSIMNNIWDIASDLGYSNVFIDEQSGGIMDDHVWVNHYANIPMIDLVQNSPSCSFFPYWHTTKDDMNSISKNSLAIVGKVLLVSIFASEEG